MSETSVCQVPRLGRASAEAGEECRLDVVSEEKDRAVFCRMVEEYGPSVMKYIRRKMGDYHDAQDIAQETFLQAFCSLDQLRTLENFRQWMFRIAFHLTVDWRRSQSRSTMVVATSSLGDEGVDQVADDRLDPQGIEDKVDADDTLSQVVREVRGLPDDYGIVLVLRYLEDLSCREIAAVLRISVSSVKVKLFRARNLLRKRLTSLEEQVQVPG